MAEEEKSKIIEGEILNGEKEPKKPRQFISEKMVGGIGLILMIIVVGYYAYNPIKDWAFGLFRDDAKEPEEVLTPEISETELLRQQVEALQIRLATVENQKSEPTEDLDARFEALENAVSGLAQNQATEDGSEPPVLDPRIATLEQELASLKETLKSRPAEGPSPNATYAQAVAALSPPLYKSLPFEGPLEQVRILVLEMPALSQATLAQPIATLSKFSLTGIASLNGLKEDFEKASIEALKIEGVPEDAGFWEKTWARIKGIVVVRQTDGSGTDLEQALTLSENALKDGDLRTTIAILESLPEREKRAFAEVLEKMENRDSALEAFNDLISFIPRSGRQGGTE